MAGADDEIGSTEGAPLVVANPMQSSVRDTRAAREVSLRLIHGGQILSKFHRPQSRQLRRFVKVKSGTSHMIATNGNIYPMGKNSSEESKPNPLPPAEAVSLALRDVVSPRGWKKAAEVTGIPYTSLRRLRDGQPRVDVETISDLRLLPGFSERYDDLTQSPVDEDFTYVAQRLSTAFTSSGAESILLQLENLSETLDEDSIANLLRDQAKLLRKAKPPKGKEKEKRQVRRNNAG